MPGFRGRHGIALLAIADLALFADVLRPGAGVVPTAWDVEVHGRLFEFAAAELRQGRLPLWNPHLFAGMPALGNPNGMMLYPASLVSLVLPLRAAIVAGTLFHTFVAAAGTYAWALRRGLYPAGCLLAGAMVGFGGPFVARVYAGHLSALAAMAWTPLLLLAVDEALRRPRAGCAAGGAVAVALLALGGHPQLVLYALLAAAGSLALGLRRAASPARAVAAFAAMLAGGLGLAAVQLAAVVDALGEAARGAALAPGAASAFSASWSTLLMLLVPHLFGPPALGAYWGDWLYWEVTPFVGVVGLGAAAYGLVHGAGDRRRGAGVLAFAFLLLALGDATPVFRLLYELGPPFDRLRAGGRALFLFGLFAAMLAAVGVDAAVRERRRSPALVAAALGAAACLAAGALAVWAAAAAPGVATARDDVEAALRMSPEARDARIAELAAGSARREAALRAAARARDRAAAAAGPGAGEPAPEAYARAYVDALAVDRWQAARARLVRTPGYGYRLRDWADPARGRRDAEAAVRLLLTAAGTCAVVAFLLHRVPRGTRAGLALALLGAAELVVFAWSVRGTFDLRALCPPSLVAFYRAAFHGVTREDHRVHDATNPNCAMSLGVFDVGGYDPFVSARYAEYLEFTGRRVEGAREAVIAPRGMHRSYGMLRLEWIVAHGDGRLRLLAGRPPSVPALPRVALVRRYEVRRTARAALEALDAPGWDPRETAILESEPVPAPDPAGGPGRVAVVDGSTDHLTIEAETPAPALLVVSDAYAGAWRARGLPGSDQRAYDVLPANHVLRAVPLTAGRHRLTMEFAPAHVRAAAVVSLASLAVLALVAARARRPRGPRPPRARA